MEHKLEWDQDGQRFYETGVKQTVLYLKKNSVNNKPYANGVAWNGVTAINEKPTGAEATAFYADDIKYLNLLSNEDFEASIEAYTYPDDFGACDGSAAIAEGVFIGQQKREMFGLCYRTAIGNDTDGLDHGYKLHCIYGANAAPSETNHSTINESPEAITMSWEMKTTPVKVTGKKPTAHLVIDSTKVDSTKLAKLESILYGIKASVFSAESTYNVGDYVTYTENTTTKTYKCKTAISTAAAWDASKWDEVPADEVGPRLPLPDEIATIFAQG